MLRDSSAFSGFTIDNVTTAKAFYVDVLGLDVTEDHGMLTLHLTNDRPTLVYPKADHTPATYTILNFPVTDIDAALDELTARGVTFIRYDDLPQDDKGILPRARQRPRSRHRVVHRHGRQHLRGAPAELTFATVTRVLAGRAPGSFAVPAPGRATPAGSSVVGRFASLTVQPRWAKLRWW